MRSIPATETARRAKASKIDVSHGRSDVRKGKRELTQTTRLEKRNQLVTDRRYSSSDVGQRPEVPLGSNLEGRLHHDLGDGVEEPAGRVGLDPVEPVGSVDCSSGQEEVEGLQERQGESKVSVCVIETGSVDGEGTYLAPPHPWKNANSSPVTHVHLPSILLDKRRDDVYRTRSRANDEDVLASVGFGGLESLGVSDVAFEFVQVGDGWHVGLRIETNDERKDSVCFRESVEKWNNHLALKPGADGHSVNDNLLLSLNTPHLKRHLVPIALVLLLLLEQMDKLDLGAKLDLGSEVVKVCEPVEVVAHVGPERMGLDGLEVREVSVAHLNEQARATVRPDRRLREDREVKLTLCLDQLVCVLSRTVVRSLSSFHCQIPPTVERAHKRVSYIEGTSGMRRGG